MCHRTSTNFFDFVILYISTIDESDYIDAVKLHSNTRERQMLKVTKCIGVKSFVEALINMVCELKITSGCKKMRKNFMVIRHSIEELLAKSMVTRP